MASQLEHYKNRDPSKRICARVLCMYKGRVLAIKRFKYGDTYFVLPGGGIDEGESDLDAAIREMREETGVQGSNPELILVLDGTPTDSEQRIVKVTYVSGTPHLPSDSEEYVRTDNGQNTYEPMWLSIEDAREKLIPIQLRELL